MLVKESVQNPKTWLISSKNNHLLVNRLCVVLELSYIKGNSAKLQCHTQPMNRHGVLLVKLQFPVLNSFGGDQAGETIFPVLCIEIMYYFLFPTLWILVQIRRWKKKKEIMVIFAEVVVSLGVLQSVAFHRFTFSKKPICLSEV